MDIKDQHKLKELPFPRPFILVSMLDFQGLHSQKTMMTIENHHLSVGATSFMLVFLIVIFDFWGECKAKNHPHGQTRMILFFLWSFKISNLFDIPPYVARNFCILLLGFLFSFRLPVPSCGQMEKCKPSLQLGNDHIDTKK